MNKNLKIEIRPIPDRDTIRSFSKEIEHFSPPTVIPALVNPVTRKYETGLTAEDVEYLKGLGCPYDLSNNYIDNMPHPFWESSVAKTELKSTPVFLYPYKNMLDFIKWKYLVVNSYIYRSETEMKTGSKPQATHFIYDESEEIEIKATKLQERNKVSNTLSTLSLDKKRGIVMIILDETTDNKDENYITVKLEQIMQDKQHFDLLKSILKEGSESLTTSVVIKKAMLHDILRKTKNGIFFFETNLGYSEEEVKEYLIDPKHQELFLSIKEKLQ